MIRWQNRSTITFVSLLVLVVCLGIRVYAVEEESPVDFTRQIRPILSDKCFLCHGPDDSSREAELRLDEQDSATEDRGGYQAIVPGDSAASELIARITTDDPDLKMPPPEIEKQLSAEEVELLRKWIDQGAAYSKHWAFEAPVRPALPELSPAGQQWARNPVDAFIFKQLEHEGLKPSRKAAPATLLRRVYLDLTGLPPSLEDKKEFFNDESPDAFSMVVERVLHSEHYGERWARHWLDAARYADSDGYEKDMQRTMWFWRDWVIDSFNQDKPYDEFIIEQIAGDLLPNATKKQRIATGYLRNSMVNEEGGADPEQFRVEGLFDRMDAIGKGILGITTQCAQCHTHKYDPLTHAEYYGMYAFLNNCEEASVIAYTERDQIEVDRIHSAISEIEENLKASYPGWKDRIRKWATEVRGNQPHWEVLKPKIFSFDGQKFQLNEDGSLLSEGYAPTRTETTFKAETELTNITGIRFELLLNPQLPANGPGRSEYGAGALTEFKLTVEPLDGSQAPQEVKFVRATSDVNPPQRSLHAPFYDKTIEGGDKRTIGPVELAIDGNSETAWTSDSGPATRNQPRKAVFIPEKPLGFPKGTRLSFTLMHSHGGKSSNKKENFLMGCFRFSIGTEPDPVADPLPAALRGLIETNDPKHWTEEQLSQAFSYWRTTVAEFADANQQISQLQAKLPDGHVQLVVQESKQRRTTHCLERGDFLSPAEEIEPGTPAWLHPFPQDMPVNRLGFAKWLVDRESPTTARSLVNRIWQEYFGTGLVETTEDIGSQSPAPSHPELLDWLAVEFMESGWSLKHLHRLIVNSSTYQQDSSITPELKRVDPRNRLLAHGPRFRVPAEVVRDLSLAVSGLLSAEVGGRSIYPPAPEFLFMPPASYGEKNWFTEEDDQQYRRSLYVHTYRSVPYPPLQVFDAPKGDAACVSRTRSNTPLQALTMLNEEQFVECSQALAARVLRESPASDQTRINHAFQLCLTREPDEEEANLLLSQLTRSRSYFQNSPEAAQKAAGKIVEEHADSKEIADLAAWTIVSRILLNLDETITKQ